MTIAEKEELLTALLHIMPSAEVRHFDSLVKVAERNPLELHTREIIELTRLGAIKIKP
jgi:hypothetical protein